MVKIEHIELFADAYKLSHRDQYPIKKGVIYSNLVARNTRKELSDNSQFDNRFIVHGIKQAITIMKESWDKFFNVPKAQATHMLKSILTQSLGIQDPNISHFEKLHDLGYLPLEIKAI
jgi:nicotinamide phosphoribosyltransferase